MSSEPQRAAIPFEPNRKKKKKSTQAAQRVESDGAKPAAEVSSPQRRPSQAASSAIPEVVSQRMLRRMVAFSGFPIGIAVLIFFGSYFLLTRNIVDFPKSLVLLTTLGCFGLSVVGLSYGALSASWDEGRVGHWFGLDEFKTNFGRLTEAWRANGDKA